jgi:serine/threonine-protein kinase
MTTITAEPQQVKFGDYTLTSKIGQGGAAEIFKARQESLDRDVAIKILTQRLCNDPDIVRRFERESLVIARLIHPNIVHVIDKGNIGGRYYFVMEYIEGTSLREVIAADRTTLETKLEIFIDVCKALDYAHKNGVIHRDIKPTNVLIDQQGNPRVADFGIAQIIGVTDMEITSPDVILGTISYMSPEQKVSSTNVDHTTDIYSMGVMLYEMLTGKKPLGHFKLPSELEPDIDPRFDDIVIKCLAQEPKDRFQNAVQLKDAVLEVLHSQQTGGVEITDVGADSFLGKCRHLDTIKETKYSTTLLVENRLSKKLYVIKKHRRGDVGRKEATLLSSLKHPHIVTIHGAGGDAKTTVIILEYMSGGSLSDRLARRYSWHQVMDIIIPAVKAVDFAHKNKIIHGNIRPSNILFDTKDNVKLTDFGLPEHYQDTNERNWYAAPEHEISKLADMYALGVVLYQLLTHRLPQYTREGLLDIGEDRRFMPVPIQQMVERLLARKPANRYQTAGEFLDDWESYQAEIIEEKTRMQKELLAPPSLPQQKSPAFYIGLVVIAIVIITLIVLLILK